MGSSIKYITVLGKKIRIRIIDQKKPADSPVLIFLHDGLGSIGQWKDFPDALSDELDLSSIIYDRHGYGNSEILNSNMTGTFMHHEALNVLPLLLDELQIRNFILVGHSDGASISLIYSCAKTIIPLAIISIAAHVIVEEATLDGIKKLKADMNSTELKSKLAKYHAQNIDELFGNWSDLWMSDEFRSWSIENDLKGISSPVLAIQGDNDYYGTSRQLDIIAENVLDSETYILNNCGHSPHLEAQDRVLLRIRNFLMQKISDRLVL